MERNPAQISKSVRIACGRAKLSQSRIAIRSGLKVGGAVFVVTQEYKSSSSVNIKAFLN